MSQHIFSLRLLKTYLCNYSYPAFLCAGDPKWLTRKTGGGEQSATVKSRATSRLVWDPAGRKGSSLGPGPCQKVQAHGYTQPLVTEMASEAEAGRHVPRDSPPSWGGNWGLFSRLLFPDEIC